MRLWVKREALIGDVIGGDHPVPYNFQRPKASKNNPRLQTKSHPRLQTKPVRGFKQKTAWVFVRIVGFC